MCTYECVWRGIYLVILVRPALGPVGERVEGGVVAAGLRAVQEQALIQRLGNVLLAEVGPRQTRRCTLLAGRFAHAAPVSPAMRS